MVRMELFKASLWEIKKSSSLKILGGVLAIAHLIQFLFWQNTGQLPLQYMLEPAPMCWPMFDSCQWLRILPIGFMRVLLYAYGVVSLISFLFFFFTRFSGAGLFFLFCAFVPGLLLYIQDFRLSSNPGYALFLFTFLYMIMPGKDRLFRYFIVSFFVASGILKLTPEWLTGDWFLEHWPHMPGKLAEWLAALSVLIELIAAPALLFRDGRYFWTGWITMFVYLCATWWATGYYGPTLFLGLLIFLAAYDLEQRKTEREFIYQSFIRPEPSKVWCNILLALFWIGVAAAHIHFPGRKLLMPLSSLLVPHPVSASERCEQSTFAVFKDHMEEIDVPEKAGRPEAMQCHPYLRFLDIKSMCAAFAAKESEPQSQFVTIASFLNTRRLKDAHFNKVFEVRDFCNPNLTFKSLGLTSWISSIGE
jgi:hypothetical protein